MPTAATSRAPRMMATRTAKKDVMDRSPQKEWLSRSARRGDPCGAPVAHRVESDWNRRVAGPCSALFRHGESPGDGLRRAVPGIAADSGGDARRVGGSALQEDP